MHWIYCLVVSRPDSQERDLRSWPKMLTFWSVHKMSSKCIKARKWFEIVCILCLIISSESVPNRNQDNQWIFLRLYPICKRFIYAFELWFRSSMFYYLLFYLILFNETSVCVCVFSVKTWLSTVQTANKCSLKHRT